MRTGYRWMVSAVQLPATLTRLKKLEDKTMNLKYVFAAATLLLLSGQALAFHCPLDMRKIDQALAANPQLDAEQLAMVKQLRSEGEALHNAGQHQESVDTLGKALAILQIQ